MSNLRQEPPASSKAPNEDLKDMDVLCIFKIEIETKIGIMGVSNTSDHSQIKVKMPNPSQVPPASSKAESQDLVVLCSFKINIETQNLEHG